MSGGASLDGSSPKSRHANETVPGSAQAANPGTPPGQDGVVDYSTGQGALDKAAHLFFMTEIARGESSERAKRTAQPAGEAREPAGSRGEGGAFTTPILRH